MRLVLVLAGLALAAAAGAGAGKSTTKLVSETESLINQVMAQKRVAQVQTEGTSATAFTGDASARAADLEARAAAAQAQANVARARARSEFAVAAAHRGRGRDSLLEMPAVTAPLQEAPASQEVVAMRQQMHAMQQQMTAMRQQMQMQQPQMGQQQMGQQQQQQQFGQPSSFMQMGQQQPSQRRSAYHAQNQGGMGMQQGQGQGQGQGQFGAQQTFGAQLQPAYDGYRADTGVIPVSGRFKSVTSQGTGGMRFRETAVRVNAQRTARREVEREQEVQMQMRELAHKKAAAESDVPPAGSIIGPNSAMNAHSTNGGRPGVPDTGLSYHHSSNEGSMDGAPQFRELKGGLSGSKKMDGVPPPRATMAAREPPLPTGMGGSMRFRESGASLTPAHGYGGVAPPRATIERSQLGLDAAAQMLSSPDGPGASVSSMDALPPSSRRRRLLKAGDGLPVRAPGAGNMGRAGADEALSSDIAFGYGHKSFEDDERAESQSASKQQEGGAQAISSMRFQEQKVRTDNSAAGRGLVSKATTGAQMAHYSKGGEVDKELEWEKSQADEAAAARTPPHKHHRHKKHRRAQADAAAPMPVSDGMPRFSELKSSEAPPIPASNEASLFSGYENHRRELHGEQGLASPGGGGGDSMPNEILPPGQEASSSQRRPQQVDPLEPLPPAFIQEPLPRLPRFRAARATLESSQSLVQTTRDSLFSDEGFEQQQKQQRQQQQQQAAAPAAPRFRAQRRAAPVLASVAGDASLDAAMKRAAAAVPRSHQASFKSMGRSMSKATAGEKAMAALGTAASAGGGSQVKANKPYEEEPIPTPTAAEVKRVSSWGKASYDNTKPGARDHGNHAGREPLMARDAHAGRSDEEMRRMRFKQIVFGGSSQLMKRADRLRRNLHPTAFLTLPSAHWHGWVEKATQRN